MELYQEFESNIRTSVSPQMGLNRGALAGKNLRPSDWTIGTAVFESPWRPRCNPREPTYPRLKTVFGRISCWTVRLYCITYGFLSRNSNGIKVVLGGTPVILATDVPKLWTY